MGHRVCDNSDITPTGRAGVPELDSAPAPLPHRAGKGGSLTCRAPNSPDCRFQLPLPFRVCSLGPGGHSPLDPLSKGQGKQLIGCARLWRGFGQ